MSLLYVCVCVCVWVCVLVEVVPNGIFYAVPYVLMHLFPTVVGRDGESAVTPFPLTPLVLTTVTTVRPWEGNKVAASCCK